MMNKLIIVQYINRLTKDDIFKFGLSQGIELKQNEVEIIYYYIKNRYKDIFDNPILVMEEIHSKISEPVYEKILELYDKYKDFIDKMR